jgi:type II secretory pathway component PulF
MKKVPSFSPHWSWWIRGGERLQLGLDVMMVLDGAGLPRRPANGIREACRRLGEGDSVIMALRAGGLTLPPDAWSLLEAGEQTGRLGEAMIRVGVCLRDRQRRRSEWTGQLWYPAMVVAVGILVMIIILFWVVPEMREVSISMGLGRDLPWITEHIGRVYGLVLGGGVLLSGLLLAATLSFSILGRKSLPWARAGQWVASRVPVWGTLRAKGREARLARQLGTLLGGGITLPAALEMTAGIAPSRWEQGALLDFRKRLLLGSGFREGLEACPLFGADSLPLLLAGQEAGRLDTYLNAIAVDREAEVERQFKRCTRFIEPFILLGLSVAIGGLVLAYLLPMVRMLERLA